MLKLLVCPDAYQLLAFTLNSSRTPLPVIEYLLVAVVSDAGVEHVAITGECGVRIQKARDNNSSTTQCPLIHLRGNHAHSPSLHSIVIVTTLILLVKTETPAAVIEHVPLRVFEILSLVSIKAPGIYSSFFIIGELQAVVVTGVDVHLLFTGLQGTFLPRYIRFGPGITQPLDLVGNRGAALIFNDNTVLGTGRVGHDQK